MKVWFCARDNERCNRPPWKWEGMALTCPLCMESVDECGGFWMETEDGSDHMKR